MGDKAKLDDQDKEAGTPEPVKAIPPKKKEEEPDKLGGLSRTESKETSTDAKQSAGSDRDVQKSLGKIQQGFVWFNIKAAKRIEVLQRRAKQQEEPDWFGQIAEGLLEMALGAGAAGAGAHLAHKFAHAAGEGGREFVKVMFEEGINAGVSVGRSKLAGGKDDNVIDPFMDAQIDGIWAAQKANQDHIIDVGDSLEPAVIHALAELCSDANLTEAADKQYDATRDAWVSYLAQSKYGSVGKRGAVQPGDVNVGPTTTNMSTQETRDKTNKSAPGFVPENAPELNPLRGATGVLEVLAELPAINGNEMEGKPEVRLAYLDGVNRELRSEYEGVALADIKIPRQITARVAGGANFTLNLDENGQANHLTEHQRRWFVSRAVVGHPENASKDEWGKYSAGLQLLLAELVPGSIKKTIG